MARLSSGLKGSMRSLEQEEGMWARRVFCVEKGSRTGEVRHISSLCPPALDNSNGFYSSGNHF